MKVITYKRENILGGVANFFGGEGDPPQNRPPGSPASVDRTHNLSCGRQDRYHEATASLLNQ